MPKNSNSKNPKPVELAAAAVTEKSKPISSSKRKRLGTEIDEIFAGKKKKKPENQEKSSGAAVTEPKKLKKNKEKSSRITKDKGLSEPIRRSRKKTADGFSLYTEEELGIGRSNAGGMTLKKNIPNQPSRTQPSKAKGIIIRENLDPEQARPRTAKQTKGEGKKYIVSSDSGSDIESQNSSYESVDSMRSDDDMEDAFGSTTPIHNPVADARKRRNDPLRTKANKRLNRFKVSGYRTIIEEKRLSTEGLAGPYPFILFTIQKLGLQVFTRPLKDYIPSWVREFYEAYAKGQQKVKGRILSSVTIRGVEVPCSQSEINEVYGCAKRSCHFLEERFGSTLDSQRGWLAGRLCSSTPTWISPGSEIKRSDISVPARYWLSFISSNLMPSQNESVLRHRKAILIGELMSDELINLGMIIEWEFAFRASADRVSLGFPCLITELCRRAGLPRKPAIDLEFTPTSLVDIRRIEAEVRAERVQPPMIDHGPEINIDVLGYDDTESSQVETAAVQPTDTTGVPDYGPSLPPPSAPTTSGPSSTYARPQLTQAAIYRMGQLAFAANQRAARLEAQIPMMIQNSMIPLREDMRGFRTTLETYRHRLDDLSVEVCEGHRQQNMSIPSVDWQTMQEAVASLRTDVDQLRTTDFDAVFADPPSETPVDAFHSFHQSVRRP